MEPTTRDPLKRFPLVSFFVLAYGIAWGLIALGYLVKNDFIIGLGFFSPALSALIMAAATAGRAGVQDLLSRLFRWKVKLRWYLVALLAPLFMELLLALTLALTGQPQPVRLTDQLQVIAGQLPALAVMLVFLAATAAGEELGWRGYAMPGLQRRFGPFWASLILGLLWGFWHLPAFWIPGSPQYGLSVTAYVLASVGFTFIYTGIYNGAKGSVLLSSLYHGASNLTLLYGNVLFPQALTDFYLGVPALVITAAATMLLGGTFRQVRQPSAQEPGTG